MPNKPCILLASSPEAKIPISIALSDSFDLLPCHTKADAISILSQRGNDIALILCTLRFDDSRMYDFLMYVQGNDQARSIPFISLAVTRSAMGALNTEVINEAVEKMLKGFGGTAFIDYFGWCKDNGVAQGNQQLLAYIEQFLANK